MWIRLQSKAIRVLQCAKLACAKNTTFQMDLVLFDVLEPRDLVRLALSHSHLLRKFPFARLYVNSVTLANCYVIRRLKCSFLPLLDLNHLTHLEIPEITTAVLQYVPHLKYLKVQRCKSDLDLPSNLQTFIGSHIEKSVTLSDSLTRLAIHNCKGCRIIGLDNHPNLTSLRFENMHGFVIDFEIPPNLVEFDMPNMGRALKHFPPSLRRFRLMDDYYYPFPLLPAALEEFNCECRAFAALPKLPCGLRVLGLPQLCSMGDLQALQLSKCASLTKIAVNYVMSHQMNIVLGYIDRMVANVTDLAFYGDYLNKFSARFANLTRLTMGAITNSQKHIDLGARGNITFFSFIVTHSQKNAALTLPPNLRTLKLNQRKDGNSGRFITMKLPATVRNLFVVGRGTFHIHVSRAHLARLEIVGDRGTVESNGQIETSWGKFILFDYSGISCQPE